MIKLSNLVVSKQNKRIIDDLSFEMKAGEIISIIGASGCGKTTLIDTMMGFNKLDHGEIHLYEKDQGESEGKLIASASQSLAPGKRGFGAVFQSHGLFPHLNVKDNILYGIWHKDKQYKEERLSELSGLAKLSDKLERDISTLSGGERQRVAITRALAARPSILFLDEPFTGLDRLLHQEVRSFIKKLLKDLKISAFVVTHDKEDAFYLSDRVILMKEGKVEQIGTPEELYETPATPYVLNFFGPGFKDQQGKSLSPHKLEIHPGDHEASGWSAVIKDRFFHDGRFCYDLLLDNDRSLTLYSFKHFDINDQVKVVRR